MPHLAEKILTPTRFSAEGVLFDVPLRAYPGKPIVCMVPRETERESGLMIPPEVADRYQPDFAMVAKFAPRLDRFGGILYPWDLELRPGMLVAVKPYTGNWYTHADFQWIPEGRILKILGTVEDWSENVLAAIELP
ncbi:MAG TPA: hypothetical protein VHE55_11200 [Fimbriimonadaceae bacterium]|nr:hypothetical protein [Fimbriimonadaceae bacterium]